MPAIDSTVLDTWARQDATNDNVAEAARPFQSFDGRIQEIKQSYRAQVTNAFMDACIARSEPHQERFATLGGRQIANPEAYVASIQVDITAGTASAGQQCSPRITDLEREIKEWRNRFGPGFFSAMSQPRRQNPAWHWGLLLFLLAVEVVLNSRFFAETSEFGLLGGTMAATTVSVVNVGLPILTAYFSHRLFYSKGWIARSGGLALGIGLIGAAVHFNYEVAEYRDHLLTSVGKAPSAWPEYYALLIIGGSIAVMSYWKMFSFMDPLLKARMSSQQQKGVIEQYEVMALGPAATARAHVADTSADINVAIGATRAFINNEQLRFDLACSQAIDDCRESLTHYHLQYCPHKLAPDPSRPEVDDSQFDFSQARRAMSTMVEELEACCKTAKEDWQPHLDSTLEMLVDLHKRHQSVVIANVNAARDRA